MKKIISILTLTLLLSSSGFSQTKPLKGPKYKNAKASEKYKGARAVLVKDKPNQFKGPKYKNLKASQYEKLVTDSSQYTSADSAHTNSSELATNQTEQIVYKRIETTKLKGKHAKGLKGPAFKNAKD